ncbi:MAG: ATP-binding cassette domain-containing protein [Methanocorpusculum sp.]|nr:ATP-binding cassette domain-containing protein [Methanocorpusculum sp.]
MTGDHHHDEKTHEHLHMHGGVEHSHPHSHEANHEHHTASPGTSRLKVKEVGFEYGAAKILEDVTVGVSPGEILAILGPNGVGKSTLLKCMNMILRPKRGTIFIGDDDLSRLSGREIARQAGYVAQRNESARMTVFDSVLLGRRPHIGWKITEHDYALVYDALEKFGLSSMQLRYVDELSGGELQRVCVCRAIVQEPSVLLLDEPTSALDLSRQMDILKLIRHVVDRHNCATIMTMHDLNLALRFADRFVFMKGGRIFAVCGKEGVTPELIEEVYGVSVEVIFHNGLPIVVPR